MLAAGTSDPKSLGPGIFAVLCSLFKASRSDTLSVIFVTSSFDTVEAFRVVFKVVSCHTFLLLYLKMFRVVL